MGKWDRVFKPGACMMGVIWFLQAVGSKFYLFTCSTQLESAKMHSLAFEAHYDFYITFSLSDKVIGRVNGVQSRLPGFTKNFYYTKI